MERKKQVVITNVHRGAKGREGIIYAEVKHVATGELLIAGTLDYCIEQAYDRYEVVRE